MSSLLTLLIFAVVTMYASTLSANHLLLRSRSKLANLKKNMYMCTAANTATNGDPVSRLFKEDINMLYDSKCNLCLMEVKYLAKKDLLGKIKFTDLEDPGYDSKDKANGNIDYATGMKHMHAIRADGEVITGVRVFRELYDAIGMGWLYSFTKLPVLGPLIDKLYLSWATYRTNLTRGVGVQMLIDQRNAEIEKKVLDRASMKNDSTNNCEAMQNAR